MSTSRKQPQAIDTSHFMAKYYHPKNIAAARGESSGVRATITTPYSKSNGLYRQKQVDDEIERIRNYKKPSSSKITVTIDSTTRLLRLYHHHHHCLDVQLTERKGKGRVVWFWNQWETATDERVMKGAIAALDSSWNNENKDSTITSSTSGKENTGGGKTSSKDLLRRFLSSGSSKQQQSPPTLIIGEKRKRAAAAAVSRAAIAKKNKKSIEVIDRVGEDG